MVIDARMKPWYPAEVSCDPRTAALVTARWREYFPTAGSRWATPSAAIWTRRAGSTYDEATVSDTVTRGIRVQVRSVFVPERSAPRDQHYFFAYHVRISNEGAETAQLMSRHWIITNADGDEQEVRGPGGDRRDAGAEAGRRRSNTPATARYDRGRHHAGQLHHATPDGASFDAAIAPFTLAMPNALN